MMLRVLVGSMTTFIVAASTQTTSLELAFASCDCPEASAAPTAAGDTCTPPNDQLYAHLLGTFVSELKGASISEKELEGYYMVENLPKAQMLDTHITKASTKFREASTKGKCNALTNRGRNPGTFEFLLEVLLAYHAMALDKYSTSSFPVTAAAAANVSHTIDQMCLGLVLGRIIQSGDIKAAESILRENIEAIKPGESFILPSKWHGGTSGAGHAMVSTDRKACLSASLVLSSFRLNLCRCSSSREKKTETSWCEYLIWVLEQAFMPTPGLGISMEATH